MLEENTKLSNADLVFFKVYYGQIHMKGKTGFELCLHQSLINNNIMLTCMNMYVYVCTHSVSLYLYMQVCRHP